MQELGFKYERPSAKITVDGVSRFYDKVWAVSTMKGRYYGGGLKIAPGQDRDSGKVSVVIMHGGSRVKTLSVFAKIKNGEVVPADATPADANNAAWLNGFEYIIVDFE
jgi:diacylglycerol kinase family enzyme